jgi:2-methylisocitrate lyase-like PEP mutase family enzyme
MEDPMAEHRTVKHAERLKELHQLGTSPTPLVLPTVWDVWSAKVAVDAGFEALTIGSHPLADSRGAKDNEGQTLDEVLTAVRPIIAAVDVPISVDLESGYGAEPKDLIAGLIDAGGAGLNLEDTVHSEGGRLRTTEEHAAYIGGLRAAADDAGVPIVVNGRTDLFARAEDRASVLDEAIERLKALAAAGADVVYPVAIHEDDALITAVVEALDVPVNITAHPGKHSLAHLRGLGVGRVSYGPLLQMALSAHTSELLARWR